MKLVIGLVTQLAVTTALAGGTKIGTGSNGLYGSEVQTPSPAGTVVVQPPAMSDEDRIAVYGPKPANEKDVYCIIAKPEGEKDWKSEQWDYRWNCKPVNQPIYRKGDLDLFVVYKGQASYFKKRAGSTIDIKLGEIKIPSNDTVAQVRIRTDVLDKVEQDKILSLAGAGFGEVLQPGSNLKYLSRADLVNKKQQSAFLRGDYQVLRSIIKFDQEQGVVTEYHHYLFVIEDGVEPGTSRFVLPGTYLIEWIYKNGSTNYTPGVIVRP